MFILTLLLLTSLLVLVYSNGDEDEAVVMLTRKVTWCSYNRAVHLASSVNERRVYLLYSKQTQDLESVAIANGSCAELKKRPYQVKAQPEVPSTWRTFGGLRSGVSKPAFIKWLASSTNLKYAWHIEDDAFFSGAWNDLFDPFRHNTADIVATRILRYDDSGRGWNKQLAIRCRVQGRPCAMRGVLHHSSWPVLRLSHRLATRIATALDSGQLTGTHEASLLAACRWLLGPRHCSFTTLHPIQLGIIVLGGERVPFQSISPNKFLRKKRIFRRRPHATDFSLPFLLRTWGNNNFTETGNVTPPHKLYHPVKCAADGTISLEACMYLAS